MEGIIFAIVLLLISSFFGKDKDKKSTDAMPPFLGDKQSSGDVSTEDVPKQPSLDDYVKRVMSELQQPKQQHVEVKTSTLKEENVVVEKEKPAVSRSERPVFASSRPIVQRMQEERKYVPNTRDELIRAVVMSEVLGPPKAKQQK